MFNEETVRDTLHTLETMRREGSMAKIATNVMLNAVAIDGEAHARLLTAELEIDHALMYIKSAEKQLEEILLRPLV